MSYDILMIGVLHAAPAPMVGHWLQSRTAVLFTSVLMAIIAIAIGQAKYAAIDLIFVALGAVMGWQFVDTKPSRLEKSTRLSSSKKDDQGLFEALVQKMTSGLVGEEKIKFESQLRAAYERSGINEIKRLERIYEDGRKQGELDAMKRARPFEEETARRIKEKLKRAGIEV